jgi:protein OS-9
LLIVCCFFQVVCDQKATADQIVQVAEPLTCSYIVTVHTPRVCRHRMLSQPKEKHVVPITCHPALVQAELDRYSAVHSAAVDTGE